MSKSALIARCAAVTIGTVLLVGVAGAAIAEENQGDHDVDVTVSIAPPVVPGVLAFSVSGTSATLNENGSTALERQFTGSLPTVTVTDTRAASEITPGAFWSVQGSATEFTGTGGQAAIGAEHLGWAPALIDGGESGQVMEGDVVDTVMDEGNDAVGLVNRELLAMAYDSAAVAEEGQWTATAELALRVPANVAPGDYAAKLTLSLFE